MAVMVLGKVKNVEARVIDSTLVVAFRNSNPNLVWKFDLERNHSFSLALQGDDGDMELGLTSPKGDFYSIARFTTRDDAEEAFAVVQAALMKGKRGSPVSIPMGFLKWLLLIAVVAVLGIAGASYAYHSLLERFTHSTGASAKIPSGVPVPADTALRPPP